MQKSNIYIDQGCDWSTPMTIQSDTLEPIDITGATLFGGMQAWYTSNTSYSFSFTIANSTQGAINVYLTANQTSLIPAGRYVYNIGIKDLSGTVNGIVEGIATINPESFTSTSS